MKNGVIMPLFAAALFAAGCGDDAGPTAVSGTASVRFFNATTGMTGSGGFTTNGQFALGSALAFGEATPTCAAVSAGSTQFGFGAANAAGSGLTDNVLTTLGSQNLTAGGNFTAVATGSTTSAKLFVLDNTYPGSVGANQAAVRFVNLAPGAGATPNTFVVYTGVFGSGGTLAAANIPVGAPSTFNTVPSGVTEFTIFIGHQVVLSGSAATLAVSAGTVNTIAIVPTTSGGFQLINLPRCP